MTLIRHNLKGFFPAMSLTIYRYWQGGLKSLWLVVIYALAVFWAHPGWADAGDPVELAAIVAQNGNAITYGTAGLKGMQLAIDQINDSGGLLGHRVKLVVLDNHSSPLRSKKAAQKAVQRQVLAVIGPMWSSHAMAAAPVLQAAGIPMVAPAATAPEVTQIGDYIFRTCYTDAFQGRLLAGFAFQGLGARSAVVIANISETYSRILASHFVDAFLADGGQIVSRLGYKGSAVDFRKILTPVLKTNPDIIVLTGYARDSALLIRQARNMGINATFLGGDAWGATMIPSAGDRLNGSYFSTHWHPDRSQLPSRQFVAAYRHRFGGQEAISPFSALAYDAINVLADAVRHAGSLAPAKIRQALADTKAFVGATGQLTFGTDGDPINKSASIMTYNNGKWSFFKSFAPPPQTMRQP